VVVHLQLLHPDNQIEMTDLYVVCNFAFAYINNSDANPNSFADAIAEEPAIARTLGKRRQQRDAREHR
jgi:hypothetical protein